MFTSFQTGSRLKCDMMTRRKLEQGWTTSVEGLLLINHKGLSQPKRLRRFRKYNHTTNPFYKIHNSSGSAAIWKENLLCLKWFLYELQVPSKTKFSFCSIPGLKHGYK